MKIAFLVSGSLGEIVLNYFIKKYDLSFVLTDKDSSNIIKICKDYNIPFYAGNPRKQEIDNFLEKFCCDIIASVNYLFIVDSKIIKIAKKLCFNIHGSLLPKYRGRTPHVWAIINNEKEVGITAHLMDEGCDTGDIIKQIKFNIQENDTGESILSKFKELYIPLVEDVLFNFQNDTITYTKQDETKATFFGKRTPEDGQIDWNWSVERIINWVRALSYPYPGAFTFYNNSKVVIDKVSKSDIGFHYNTINGTIISINPLLVKCCNSVLKLEVVRSFDIEFKINENFT